VKTLKKRVIQFVLIFITNLICTHLSAQGKPKQAKFVDPREAKEHFSHGNFLAAIPVYKELLKKDPNDVDYNHKIGICYLYTNINKTLAIPYLEKASKSGKADNRVWKDMGLAYQYGSKFDDAIKAYTTYKATAPAKEIEEIDHRIETCENGKEYVKHPVNVTFQNLGMNVNSQYPDYYPLVPENESFVIFTSRRKGNTGASQVEVDGYYSSDIYISLPLNDQWGKPKNMGGMVNTALDEQAVGLTPDGQTMLMYIDHIDSSGNIYSSANKAGAFQRMKKLNENVNGFFETAGSITKDGNIIFFASQRPGGEGETDIYMARKLPNGNWAQAQNLGNKVNSRYKEDFPEIAPDGKTLYFSSQGHAGMGDFDLFKTVWDEPTNTWSEPKNLGYPVNSVGDDRSISFTENNRIAYISAVREGGFGDLDLYRIKFNDAADRYTVLLCNVVGSDSAKLKDAAVTVIKANDPDPEPYIYTPNSKTGKFIMAFTPGKYQISIQAKGYKTYSDFINIFDFGAPNQNETKKTFILQK
jgi:hypothetical protein